jgi:hypothetical protein
MKLVKLFTGRLPDRQSILGVYAVIVFLVYSWTLFTSFYKLPSWMFYLTIGQILSVYAYAFSVDLLESILALAVVLFLDFTLFLALKNREEFQSRSILLILVVLISSMLRLALFQSYDDIQSFLSGELTWWTITFLLALVIAAAAPKSKWIRKVIEGIAERATVFLYIYLPLSLISLVTVIIRNIY